MSDWVCVVRAWPVPPRLILVAYQLAGMSGGICFVVSLSCNISSAGASSMSCCMPLVQYTPVLAPHMSAYVHHMILYECRAQGSVGKEHLEQWMQHLGVQCYSPNMPESWSLCNMPIVAWATGSEGENRGPVRLGQCRRYFFFLSR